MAITIPSFQRRSLSRNISAAGRMGDPEAIGRLPLLTAPRFGPGNVGTEWANLGKIITGWGDDMKRRQDGMKATQLFSDTQISAAEFESTLLDKDFADWPDSISKNYDRLITDAMKNAREAGLGPDALDGLSKSLFSSRTNAIIEGVRRAKRTELDVTKNQTENLKKHTLKIVQDHGLASTTAREAMGRYYEQLDNSVEVLGEAVVAGLKIEINVDAENESLERMVENDPQAVLDYEPRYTTDIEKFRSAAQRKLNQIEAKAKEDIKTGQIIARENVTSFLKAVNGMNPADADSPNATEIYANQALQARALADEILAMASGTSAEPGTTVDFMEPSPDLTTKVRSELYSSVKRWHTEQISRIDAGEALFNAKELLNTASRGDIPGIIQDYEDLLKAAINRGDNAFAIQGKIGLAALVRYGKQRDENISTRQQLEHVFTGAYAGGQSPHAQALLNTWLDGAVSTQMTDMTQTPGGGEISWKQWALDNRVDPDDNSKQGPGIYFLAEVLLETGQMMDFLRETLDNDLHDPRDGAADIQRYNSVRIAHQFSLDNPSVFAEYSDDMQWAVKQFRLYRTTNPDAFGEGIRRGLYSPRVGRDVTGPGSFNETVDAWDSDAYLADKIPSATGRLFGDLSKIHSGMSWGGKLLSTYKAFRDAGDDALTEEEIKHHRNLTQRIVNGLTKGPFWPGFFPKDTSLDLTKYRDDAFNVAAIREGFRQLTKNYARTGNEKYRTIEDAADAAFLDTWQHVRISNWGNPVGGDMTLQFMDPLNPAYHLGDINQVAKKFADDYNLAQGDTLDGFVATPDMFKTGELETRPDLRHMRNGIPMWQVLRRTAGGTGDPLRDADGRIILFQPEVDTTRQREAMDRAQMRSGNPINKAMKDKVGFLYRLLKTKEVSDLSINQFLNTKSP